MWLYTYWQELQHSVRRQACLQSTCCCRNSVPGAALPAARAVRNTVPHIPELALHQVLPQRRVPCVNPPTFRRSSLEVPGWTAVRRSVLVDKFHRFLVQTSFGNQERCKSVRLALSLGSYHTSHMMHCKVGGLPLQDIMDSVFTRQGEGAINQE